MDTPTLRQLLSDARLPASVDVSRDGDDAYVMHDSATGEPLSFSWPRAEVVMATVNALPQLLDVVEAAEAMSAEWNRAESHPGVMDDLDRRLRRALEALHGK